MSLVRYEVADSIAWITMDDGKVNVLSPAMLTELNEAFTRAEADAAVVVLSGRDGVFSAGFDLPVLRAGGSESVSMLRAGFDLAERILGIGMPVVIACTGHAIAMGVFLLLCGDYRVGTAGPYRITANEVAIGVTMPHAAVEICRQRLSPAHFNRATILAEVFPPDKAVDAGFLDQLADAGAVGDVALSVAAAISKLDMASHAATKARVRRQSLAAVRAAIEADTTALAAHVG